MKMQRLGAVIAALGAVYLVMVAWMSSWWYVPALLELGPRAFIERPPYGGKAFSILWASSGVLGAILVALGAAVYSAVGRFRLLLLAAGGTLPVVWLGFWSDVFAQRRCLWCWRRFDSFVLLDVMSGLGGNSTPS